jgi:hypothetical protein
VLPSVTYDSSVKCLMIEAKPRYANYLSSSIHHGLHILIGVKIQLMLCTVQNCDWWQNLLHHVVSCGCVGQSTENNPIDWGGKKQQHHWEQIGVFPMVTFLGGWVTLEWWALACSAAAGLCNCFSPVVSLMDEPNCSLENKTRNEPAEAVGELCLKFGYYCLSISKVTGVILGCLTYL